MLLCVGRVQEAHCAVRLASRHLRFRNPVDEPKVRREFDSSTVQHLTEGWWIKIFCALKSDRPGAVLAMRAILHEDACSQSWRSIPLYKEHELPRANCFFQRR